jgi:hypothetical protein
VTVDDSIPERRLRGHEPIRHRKARKTVPAQFGVGRNRSTHADNNDNVAALSRAGHENDHVPYSRPKELSGRFLPNHEGLRASEGCGPNPLRCPSIHRIQHAYRTFVCPWGSARYPRKPVPTPTPALRPQEGTGISYKTRPIPGLSPSHQTRA